MKIFNTITNLSGAKLQAGQYVGVYGATSKGDTGAGMYYIEHSGYTPGVDDVILGNTNVARLVVRWFDAMNPEFPGLSPNEVTNAMLATVATSTMKGRLTAGTGDVEDLTATQVRTLLGIEAGATADMTGAEIKVAYEAEADTNAFTDAEKTKVGYISVTQAVDLDAIELAVTANSAKVTNATHTGDVTGSTALTIAPDVVTNAMLTNVATSTIKGRISGGTGDPEDLTAAQVRALINVEDGATADMSGAEIKVAYEAEADTNVFTDAEKVKLNGIEASATADMTGAEIKVAYEAEADTNAYDDAAKAIVDELDATGLPYGANVIVGAGELVKVKRKVWKGMIGCPIARTSGLTDPDFVAVRGGANDAYAFSASDEIQFLFHIPHDYALGTDIFFHVDWLHNGTAINGTMTWAYAATYAKGHNQAEFPAEVTGNISYATVDIATTPKYRYRVDEIQLSASTPSGSQIDTDLLEPDGLIMININASAIPTITGGSPNEPFMLTCGIHYQADMDGTLNKAPDFYA